MRKNIYKKQYGFSLIETLIAVSILMIAIAGPLSLVQAGLFSSIHQRNQVTATYLAQEALEYIKNWRDANSYTQYGLTSAGPKKWLTGPDGNDNSLLSICAVVSNGCYVDPHGTLPSSSGDTRIQAVGANNFPLLQHNNSSGVFSYYGYVNGDAVTPYKRTIIITPVPANNPNSDEATVSATVTWSDNGLSRSYTVNENIYNYTYEQTP